NLDSQNGGFTAFGRIINGITAPDLIASLTTQDFGSPFDQLPLRDSYDGQTVRPADFVNVATIAVNGDRAGVVNQSLTYTVTSSDNAVVSAYLYNGRLVIAPGQNHTGTATVTVHVTGVDGSVFNDAFSVTIDST